MLNPYASDKAALFPDRVLAASDLRRKAPIHLQLILSNVCNQKCTFCAYRMEGYASNQRFDHRAMMQVDKAREILSDAAEMGVKSVQFTGGGEPTVHAGLPGLMRHADQIGLDVALVTNCAKISEEVADATMLATWMRISLDAGTPATYSKIRQVPPDSYMKTLNNVEKIVKKRAESRSAVYIGIGFVVTSDNWEEIPSASVAAKECGADSIRFSAAFTTGGDSYFDTFGDKAQSLISESKSIQSDSFSVVDNFSERRADLKRAGPDYKTCLYQDLTTYVGADLNLYRCCVLAYNDRGLVGSLQDRRLPELWWSQDLPLGSSFDARGCPACQFDGRNHAILSLAMSLPRVHGSFV